MTHTVLFLEDDPVQTALILPLLQDGGFNAVHATNGADGLAFIEQGQIDVVLSDHYMPNMNGLEFIAALNKRRYSVPVVIMTSSSDLALAFSALKAGAADFISKDAECSYLSIIESVLSRTISQHELQQHAQQLSRHLEETKNLAHMTLNAISQGVVTVDHQLTILSANNHFLDLFSLVSRDVIGRNLDWLVTQVITQGVFDGYSSEKLAQVKLREALADSRLGLEIRLGESILELKCAPLLDKGYILTFVDITSQKEQLISIEGVINAAPVAMFAIDQSGRIMLANRKACELVDASEDDVLSTSIGAYIPEQYRHNHGQLISNYFDDLTPRQMRPGVDLQLLNIHGDTIPVEVSLSGIEVFGEPRVLATVVDISNRKKAEQVLRRAHELTQSIIDHSPFSIVATDTLGQIIAVSPALEKLLWYRRDELIQQCNVMALHDTGELEARAVEMAEDLGFSVAPGFDMLVAKARLGIVEGSEWSYIRKNGSSVPVNLTVTCLRNDTDEITGFLMVAYDITEQKRAHEYITHIAHHDGLTGLPNRGLMLDRLKQSLSRRHRKGDRLGVLVLDLDNFKRINDSLGHLAGDQMLMAVASRLTRLVRESDTVCRMGGDEFVIILPDIKTEHDIVGICEKILVAFKTPINIGNNKILVTPSIGVSVAPEDGDTAEKLLQHADIAMYQAKKQGRNGYSTFDRTQANNSIDSLVLEEELREVVHHEGLHIHYQPQVDISDNSIIGFEALVRWQHETRGPISPEIFIPLAESTGVILNLGEWVLRKACFDIQALRLKHKADYRIAVNVSPRQFEEPRFVNTVFNALKDAGLPPRALELEITEGLLVTESEITMSKLTALREMGVLLAIDDFGTGYSNLSYVSKYPINIIKIDRCFMSVEEKANIAIVSAITAIGDGLELEVLAEGVETKEQLEFVRERGCCHVQGYYYSRPVPLSALEDAIKTIKNLPGSCNNAAGAN